MKRKKLLALSMSALLGFSFARGRGTQIRANEASVHRQDAPMEKMPFSGSEESSHPETVTLLPPQSQAALAGIEYAPHPNIQYDYTTDVQVGTIRYMNQISSGSYFNWSYWPTPNSLTHYSTPGVECGTASISMALSYIGINKTPRDLLIPYDGKTMFGVTYGATSTDATPVQEAISRYLNGNGQYSPPIIHIDDASSGYTGGSHYFLVIGAVGGNTYRLLDPANQALTSGTISGSRISVSRGTFTIDSVCRQWYKAGNSLPAPEEPNDPPVMYGLQLGSVGPSDFVVQVSAFDEDGIDRVQFPTWTSRNGQDDLDPNWPNSSQSRGDLNGNRWEYRVNPSDHGDERGFYQTHIYAYDRKGLPSALCAIIYLDPTNGDDPYGTQVLAETIWNGRKYVVLDPRVHEGARSLRWDEASTYCQSVGGHLVTIGSQEENRMVRGLIDQAGKSKAWIGANDLEQENLWTWSNNEPLLYSNWQASQPDNHEGRQDTAMMLADGTWDDTYSAGFSADQSLVQRVLYPHRPQRLGRLDQFADMRKP